MRRRTALAHELRPAQRRRRGHLVAAALAWRRPVLAIVGATGTGKSLLGGHILEMVAKLLDLPGFLEVTVQNNGNMDLSEFDVEQHAGVLLDGVGDVTFLHDHREVLQGRPKIDYGGKSATMMYSYPFTFARRAVVATFDLGAHNLSLLSTHHWLSNSNNVCVLRLTEPAFGIAPRTAGPSGPSRMEDVMRAWSVNEVASWLESADAGGIATVCRANAVRGVDLMSFSTAAELSDALRLAPFAARRLLELRAETSLAGQ